jgi:MobA/MobL family
VAIFHMRAQVISRSAGRSAIAAAAYRAGERLRDERTGQLHDYTRKAYVEHREIMAPVNAPSWMRDRSMLWSGVEAAEKRKDAQLAREVHFALPRELDRAGRIELIRDFCRQEFVERGMIADVAVHNPPDRAGADQPHAHVMLTTRVLTGDGFGQKARDWNDKALYEAWRGRWAARANRALERFGSAERIDHRSFAKRGIDREPEPKLGPKAARLEREEQRVAANENRPAVAVTERGQEWQQVRERNQIRDQMRDQVDGVMRELREIAERFVATAREQLEAAWQRMERAVAAIQDRFANMRSDITRADGVPVPERTPVDPVRTEPPSEEKLLGRKEPEREDQDRDKAVGEGRTSDSERPGDPGQAEPAVERDVLLGKTPRRADRPVPTPADLLGRGSSKSIPQRPGRSRER